MKKATVFIPIMLAFFAMGSVDMVGIATNYAKGDFALSDTVANLLPSMVFLWFFIFSVPTGLLMNRIGRRKTVLISLAVTLAALLLPLVSGALPVLFASFALLGIGNTLMQVSLNPLIANVVSGARFASTLTLGQLVKAMASFSAPFVASWAARALGDWRLMFPIYSVFTLLALLWLGGIKIREEPYATRSSFADSLRLLGNPGVLLFFVGIMAHVGIDVGVNTTAPKILLERVPGLTLDAGGMLGGAGVATSVYFLFRLLGCLSGTLILARCNHFRFFVLSAAMIALSAVGFFCFSGEAMLYACLALVGFGNANIFPVIFARAVQSMPARENEVSGLMIMGIAGGAVFPLLMGVLADGLGGQAGAVLVVALLAAYLLVLSPRIRA